MDDENVSMDNLDRLARPWKHDLVRVEVVICGRVLRATVCIAVFFI